MSRRGENIYKRKDGRWEGRYIKGRQVNGRAKYGYVYSYTYADVREKLFRMKAIHANNYAFKTFAYKGTLREWASWWLLENQSRVKPSTITSYANKMNNHILPQLGNLPLQSIQVRQLNQWVKELGNTLSPNSVRIVFQVLKSCLSAAERKRVLPVNPCKDVLLPKRTTCRINALTSVEQQRLTSKASNHPKGLAIVLALETGMRIGELAGLKWQDIDFSTSTLIVSRTVQRVQRMDESDQKTQVMEGTPKSESSTRLIPLSRRMTCILQKRKANHSLQEFVFGGDKPSEPRVISNWLKKICDIGELSSIRFHQLRHSFATRCIEKGISIVTISDLLGHGSTKMTLDTYTNSFFSEKRKAINLLF